MYLVEDVKFSDIMSAQPQNQRWREKTFCLYILSKSVWLNQISQIAVQAKIQDRTSGCYFLIKLKTKSFNIKQV